ncbi:MAG: hypothetical protein H6700_11075 [Myxococcales bacterium]|nr:hypothetical protein [Myxococcales bacterium]MCB9532298.1 hypothetical protein [Myxococcales bacterium]
MSANPTEKAAAGKKPVWVDEDAHAILKQYSKLTKASMVEVASNLVLSRLHDLDPASGLVGASAAEPASTGAAAAAEPASNKPAPMLKPIEPLKRTSKRAVPNVNDNTIRYVGGIWLV